MRTLVRIYIAGPLGFSELGRQAQQTLAEHLAALGYIPIDPFTLAPQEAIDRLLALPVDLQQEGFRQLNVEIGRTNTAAIDSADAILAVLDGPDVDSGTAAEIGYAYGRGKPIIGYRGDFRLSADNIGGIVNLQVEYFIRASGGVIVTTLAATGPALASLVSTLTA